MGDEPSFDWSALVPHVVSSVGVNVVKFTGVVGEDPIGEISRLGEPVTLLMVDFPLPDTGDVAERRRSACCSVEVPQALAAELAGRLEKGTEVFVCGHLAGGGDVLATSLVPLGS